MKPKPNCPYCASSCSLLRKLEETDDFIAFIDEYVPIEIVFEEMRNVSKDTLECTCCLYGNMLFRITAKSYRWRHLRRIRCKMKLYLVGIKIRLGLLK